jgi:Signal transduction histidine kinase regulating citrate/malate metabolism
VSDLYLACDDEWRLTLVNARAGEYLRLLGPERGDPIGRSVWEVIPGLVGSRFQAEAFRALVEQAEVEFEGFFAPLKRWFSVRITPSAEGIIACVRDATGWRQTKRTLTR